MKLKLLLPALAAVPVIMMSFKSANTENATTFASAEKINYQSQSYLQKELVAGEGFIAHTSTVSKSAETSTVSSSSAISSFASPAFDDSSLRDFLSSHE